MKSEVIDVSGTRKQINVEIEAEEVKAAYDTVSREFASKANVPGFRQGMAPVDVVRMRYKDEIRQDVLQRLLQMHVQSAIADSGLNPLKDPDLDMDNAETVKFNGSEPITIKVHLDVMPEIPDPEYKGLKADRMVEPVEEEKIEQIIDEQRQQHKTMLPVEDRKSEEGDVVLVDLKGTFLDDENADPIEVNDLEVNLGDGSVEPAFTDNLLGVEADDVKEFEVEYADDSQSSALAGRKIKYHAEVKSVGTVEIPEADDEWVVSLDQGFESIADLREQLRKDLESMSKADADARVRTELIGKLIENYEFEVPAALVDNQAQTLLNNFAQDLAQRGVDLSKVEEDFLKTTYEQMKTQAARDVRGAMLLEKVAEAEGVEVGDEEVNEEIKQMAEYYQVSEEQMKENVDQQGGPSMIWNNLRTRKAVEAIVENAEITDKDWEPPQPEGFEADSAVDSEE